MVALTNKEYQQRISLAEAAVSDVTDPQLKQVAFGKILEQLLAPGSEFGPAPMARPTHVMPATAVGKSAPVSRGPVGLIEGLVNEDFFQPGKSLRDVQTELQNRGHRIPRTSLSGPLQGLCRRRVLRRTKETPAGGNNAVYIYSKW